MKKAAALNEQGVRKPAPAKPWVARALTVPKVPADLAAALRKNAKAQETFDAYSPSNKRGYVEWIAEARGAATRARRLATAIEWMAEGKVRNWKYVRT